MLEVIDELSEGRGQLGNIAVVQGDDNEGGALGRTVRLTEGLAGRASAVTVHSSIVFMRLPACCLSLGRDNVFRRDMGEFLFRRWSEKMRPRNRLLF